MPVTTHIDRARTRLAAEREAAAEKYRAFGRLIDRVGDVPAEPTQSTSAGLTPTAGARLAADPSTEDRCRAVRTAVAETIHPECGGTADGAASPLATVREEFADPIAAALSSTTDAGFTPQLKRTVLAAATSRRAEVAALRRALSREASHLADAADAVEDVTAWLVEADETPLTGLGFEALRRRHETLADHRERCGALAERRQAFLEATTSEGVEAGVRHRRLVPSLYEDFPVDHPVLATVGRLDAACGECQRAVRRHLVRRA